MTGSRLTNTESELATGMEPNIRQPRPTGVLLPSLYSVESVLCVMYHKRVDFEMSEAEIITA